MNTSHPTFVRMQAVAAFYRCTAQTPRGVYLFITKSIHPTYLVRAMRRYSETPKQTPAEWWAAVAARKADPDAKRARDGSMFLSDSGHENARFRRNYLAGLRRREKAAIEYDSSTLDGVLERAASEESRRAELREVARLRAIVTGEHLPPRHLPPCEAGILVGGFSGDLARKHGASIDLRGRDRTMNSTRGPSFGIHEDGHTEWKRGKPCGYTRAVHDNYVRSFAVIVDPQTLDYVFHCTRVQVTLPDGYRWHYDQNGLRAIREASPADDYHPTAHCLLAKYAATHIVRRLEDLRERREAMRAATTVEAARAAGVWVCLADSLRAGNCLQGTLAFGERHGLDRSRHYEAPELLAIANGDASRVRLAVTAARLRHEREVEAGVCQLKDHQVQGTNA